jgi:hypothetical protein
MKQKNKTKKKESKEIGRGNGAGKPGGKETQDGERKEVREGKTK